ncbi:MAG: flavodoxin family protein [Desulfocapsaceae bacterium]|nr:flavodoxin family protein [Desulfocapsaceae bacterium]
MKKTVVLMASPRLQSNTDILANRVMDGIRSAGSEEDIIDKTDLVELQEFVCCACGQCRAAGECLQFPEVTEILEKIEEADNLVLATPTWWLGPSSYLKIFMDHWGAFLRPDYTSRIAGKRAAVVSCCGNAEINLADQVCSQLSELLSFLKVDVVGTLGVKGVAEIGAVSRDRSALEKAFQLGVALNSK